MSARARSAALALALAAAAAGCADARQHQRAICVLVDVSGTYADQRADVVRIVKSGLLPRVRPGDTFMVIRIGDQSYDKESVEATATLDSQPSHANAQKLRLALRRPGGRGRLPHAGSASFHPRAALPLYRPVCARTCRFARAKRPRVDPAPYAGHTRCSPIVRAAWSGARR